MNLKFSQFNIIIEKDNNEFYLFNSNSGATFLIDEDVKKRIEEKDIKSFSEEEIRMYEKNGIVVKDEVDETRMFSYLYNKQKFDNDVLSITMLLTYECNLRCVYCYEGAGEVIKGSLDDDSRARIIKFIKNQMEERGSKVLSMVLFGGEPLLNISSNYKWLDEIKEYCENNGKQFITSMVTNGILLNEEVLDKLKFYNCESVQITLDGVRKVHDIRRIYKDGRGSFDEVMRGIKLLYNHKELANPIIRINIDKNNIQEVKELLVYLKSEGLEGCFVDFGVVKGTTNACSSYTGNCFIEDELGDILDELWDILEEFGFNYNDTPQKKNMFCGLFSDSAFTISPFGEIYKCWDHVGMENHLMGKIDEDGNVIDITYRYVDWMSHNPTEVEECRSCKYLPACGGGCASVSYSKDETYHSSGCYKVKGVVEKQVNRLMNRRLEAAENA